MKIKFKPRGKKSKIVKAADIPKKKYIWKSVNAVEDGEWVVGMCGRYCVTPTGRQDADGRYEIEGYFESGEKVLEHYVPEWQPFRVDEEAVTAIKERYRNRAEIESEIVRKRTANGVKALKQYREEKKSESGNKVGFKLKLKFKKKFKIKMRT